MSERLFDPEETSNQFHALSMAIKRLTERVEKLEKQHIADTSKKIPAPDLVEDYGYDLAEAVEDCGDLFKKGNHGVVTTSYMANGATRRYYGQNGACVEFNRPLPTGFTLTIEEPSNE